MANVIVVAGGIGSGKSTVVKRLDQFFPTINADKIVDDAYEDAGLPVCQQVAARFGSDIIEYTTPTGRINKLILRERLETEQDYKELGQIWSTFVNQKLDEFTERYKLNSFVVWEVPLAIESGITGDYLIAVVAPTETRIQRVMARSKLSYAQVMLRMKCQATLETVVKHASHIICNNCSIEELNNRVDVLAAGLLDLHYANS